MTKERIKELEEELKETKKREGLVMRNLGVDEPDDIEEALESNSNLEARIAELESTYPPDCVFDTLRHMCFVILSVGPNLTPTGLLAKRVAEQSPSIVPDQVVADGLRWMIDNDPRGI